MGTRAWDQGPHRRTGAPVRVGLALRALGRRDADDLAIAERLFEIGVSGVDRERNVAVDELNDDFAVTRPTARLWPQTERLKAALILAQTGVLSKRAVYWREAADAAAGLRKYLETSIPGLWFDKMQPDGTLVDEPAPASSLYHIACAISELREAAGQSAA